jgi:hypothetical protein
MAVMTRTLFPPRAARRLHPRLALPGVSVSRILALTPVGASSKVALTPEGASVKLRLSCVLQARLSCVCACTPLDQSCVHFPLALTPDDHRPPTHRREGAELSTRRSGGALTRAGNGSRDLPECRACAASEASHPFRPGSARPAWTSASSRLYLPSEILRRPPSTKA